MSDLSLYSQLVLEHYRNPRGRGSLTECTHAADGVNPLCGDSLRIELRCVDARIVELGFSGEACAIATATASMLGERIIGLDAISVDALAERFVRLVTLGSDDAEFGELNAMRELRIYPSRRKCALLAWETVRAALAGNGRTTTEKEPG